MVVGFGWIQLGFGDYAGCDEVAAKTKQKREEEPRDMAVRRRRSNPWLPDDWAGTVDG